MIEVYAAHVPEADNLEIFSGLFPLMSEARRHQIHSFLRKEDALRGLTAEWLIRSIIGEKLALAPGEIRLEKDSLGKPFLTGRSDFHFNVSHSALIAAAAISRSPVGVDVEKIAPIDLKVAEQVFSHEELEELFSLPENLQLDRFYTLWTLKESLIKAIGKGFFLNTREFTITTGDEIIVTGAVPCRYYFRSYEIAGGYKLAACGTENQFSEKVLYK